MADDCVSQEGCKNGGSCNITSGECTCLDGFSGLNCRIGSKNQRCAIHCFFQLSKFLLFTSQLIALVILIAMVEERVLKAVVSATLDLLEITVNTVCKSAL